MLFCAGRSWNAGATSRPPDPWIPPDAGDTQQLLGAIAQDRWLFTFNIGDFRPLTRLHPAHGDIVLAQQLDWALSGLTLALDSLLPHAQTEARPGQVRGLNV